MTTEGETWKGEPCPGCGCRATGMVIGHNTNSGEPLDIVEWDPPDLECEHGCHAPWRMIHKGELVG